MYDLCRQVLDEVSGPVRTRFGYSDDDALAVGLTCGGELDILVQRIDPAHQPPVLHGLLAVATASQRLSPIWSTARLTSSDAPSPSSATHLP